MEKKDKDIEKGDSFTHSNSNQSVQKEGETIKEAPSLAKVRMKKTRANSEISTLSFTTLSTLRQEPVYVINAAHRRRCTWTALCVILQCLAVFIGSYTILYCYWTVENAMADYNKLIRIMYLYDHEACGTKMETPRKGFNKIVLGKNTSITGLSVRLIESTDPVLTVSTRLTESTRMYIKISIGMHAAWMITALVMWLFCELSVKFKRFKIAMTVFMISSTIMVAFDVSMAIVYIAHIQQTLNEEMILRYSGWSNDITLERDEDFAGWIPMCASACWMRGIVFEVLNIYSVATIRRLRQTLIKGELNIKVVPAKHTDIPEPCMQYSEHKDTLLQRQS